LSKVLLENRPDVALLHALVVRLDTIADRLGAVIERLDRIEARITAPDPGPGDIKATEATAHLAAAGLEPTLGPDDLAALLQRSRRDVDRLRASGELPKPDLRIGESARWRPQTVKSWLDRQGGPQ
jgi:hypothetical protein